MRVLFIHNKYQYKGGEDTVFEAEVAMLKKYGNDVSTLLFNNVSITGALNKIKYGINSFYSSVSAKSLERMILDFSPDIIHVHNFFPIASPSIFFVANKYNIPIVITLHNYRLLCPNAMFFLEGNVCERCINKLFPVKGVINGCYRNSKLETFSLASMILLHRMIGTWHNRIDRFIVLTNFAKNKFIKSSMSLPENKIRVKPNFVVDNGLNYDKDDYFLFVGRLSEEKGIDILLDAFEGTKYNLQIIGTGPKEKDVQVSSLRNKNTIYLGYQTIDVIKEKLKKAKALIFTSILYEGMPMTILEAFSTGTPVIGGNIGGPAEMVKDNYNGLLYEAGNVIDLKNKVDWLYKHPKEAMEMSKNARKEFESFYTEENNYKQLMQIYSDAINEKEKSNK